MKLRLFLILSMSLLILMAFAQNPPVTSERQNIEPNGPIPRGASLYITPAEAGVYLNHYIELTVCIEDCSEPLYSYELGLEFDPDYLSLEDPGDIRRGDMLSSHGETEFLHYEDNGIHFITESFLGTGSEASGSGTLFHIRLKALHSSSSAGVPVSFSSVVLRDPLNQDITPSLIQGSNIIISELDTQLIQLQEGWNIISSRIVPESTALTDVFASLMASGTLIKVQSSEGSFLEKNLQGTWINSIGDYHTDEGYKVNVSESCILEITGIKLLLPHTLHLDSGWNTISYMLGTATTPANTFAALISSGALVKVLDEAGLFLEQNLSNVWVDNIHTLIPGEGYRVFLREAQDFTYPAEEPETLANTAASYYQGSIMETQDLKN